MNDREKKLEQIRIAKMSDKLMMEGGTDSDSAVAIITNDGDASRQLYHALGHETLQSVYDPENSGEIDGLSNTQSLPYNDNHAW
jgi:hypothetical protein